MIAEKIANDFIKKAVNVEKKVMDRNNAEKKYGFRLYQGGVPLGNNIRVLNIPGVDVEACGGTHLNNTSEIEKIRIIKIERIQDGVNRVVFAAGKMADAYKEKEEKTFEKIVKTLELYYKIKTKENISEQLAMVSKIFSVQTDQLEKTINRFIKETKNLEKKTVDTLFDAAEDIFNSWKKTQKEKKEFSSDEIEELLESSEEIDGIKIITICTDSDATALAGKLVKGQNVVAHVFDGEKLVSMASEDIKIDLREISLKIGKILGGSGGGRPRMTQCGGPNKDKINDALDIAKKETIKKLKK